MLRRTRARAAQRQRLAESVLDTTGALVLVCDSDGRTLEANPAMQRFTGRTAEELIGVPFWEIVVIPEEVQLARLAVADVLAGGASIPAEVDWLAAGGERRRVELHTSVVPDERGGADAVAFVGVDVTVHRQREARYQHQAMHDDLTGVANRGALFHLLTRCLDADTGNGCGLLFCDLDGFKAVNDTWGHAVGDQVLIAVAALLRAVAGEAGVAARMGGDEFVILFRGTDRDQLDGAAREVARRMGKPFDLGGVQVGVGVSIGAAVGEPGTDPDALISEADMAMYGEKHARGHRTAPRPDIRLA
jgi:diguanylate cyclase (GGDEF)-like protein/PAS domain S-box-containing protein